ncbi:MAG: DUF6261 family protein [Dysgonamonadaceae bacterium]|jgi:hypothetical protein|nr:DUF6261 family protein [Dysgonamonadaceae bacterium]
MEQLRPLQFGRLKIDAHCGFLTHTSEAITASPEAVKAKLGDLQPQFEDKLKTEKAIMDWQRRSPITKEIKEADKRQDTALTALRILVKGQTYSFGAPNAAAAERVYMMLNKYGNVNRKPYQSQIGDIESILRQLAGPYSSDVTWLLQYAPTISAQITELKNANIDFKTKLNSRGKYYNTKPDKTFHQIQKEIEPIYHEIARIINANAITKTDPGFAAIINLLNPEIDILNLEFHRIRHNLSKSKIVSIPEQYYTGLPVTPTPEVFIQPLDEETVRLEIGKDYNLRFIDNVEVGNATLTIHGVGSYKGKKSISFIIKRV